MNTKQILLLTLVMSVIISCKKDSSEPEPLPIDQTDSLETPPTPQAILQDSLLTGTNCTSFSRQIFGYGMEDITAGKQSLDGGYILCGNSETIASDDSDVLVIKTDCFGEVEWSKAIPSAHSDQGRDIFPVSTGGFLLAEADHTYSTGSHSYSARLTKLGDTANVEWTQAYNFGSYTFLNRVIELPSTGYAACGFDHQGFVFTTDFNGAEIWRYEFPVNTYIFDLVLKSNQNIAVCGTQGLDEDIFVAELSPTGSLIWSNSIDKDGNENMPNSIQELSGGDLIISGSNRTSGTTFAGFILRLDGTSGAEQWYNSLEDEGYGEVGTLAHSADNMITLSGNKSGGQSIVKIDPADGSVIWESTHSISVLIRDMISTVDGGYFLSGNILVEAGNRDAFYLKVDEFGN